MINIMNKVKQRFSVSRFLADIRLPSGELVSSTDITRESTQNQLKSIFGSFGIALYDSKQKIKDQSKVLDNTQTKYKLLLDASKTIKDIERELTLVSNNLIDSNNLNIKLQYRLLNANTKLVSDKRNLYIVGMGMFSFGLMVGYAAVQTML